MSSAGLKRRIATPGRRVFAPTGIAKHLDIAARRGRQPTAKSTNSPQSFERETNEVMCPRESAIASREPRYLLRVEIICNWIRRVPDHGK
jgi:hypothetical protein